ncbi:protein kinase domain-containing protein [Citrus sinensis]|uniref:Protein kinase domain-containing protein n=1 Tax=Citrus sinensis TaxID=2711 RepID=A0ACB8N3W0_CITSI|nr:protein kinase domain-containing protein [Citrus sinensis]
MSSEEASIFSTFLLFLLMFVFSTGEIEARKVEVQMCSSSYGDVKNISYHFRLKGDPAGCGHPELQLPCESNKIILEFNSAKYYVKRISYDKCTISVAEVNLANGSCSLPLHQQCRSSGKDGFGSVYKGQLHTGGLIAVKMLENSNFSAVEFINEVSTIGRIHHVNVVQLLGFYSEGSKRALVYEYMPNGSLDRHIFPNEGRGKSFSWEKLHEVALGTARGIEYLHNG